MGREDTHRDRKDEVMLNVRTARQGALRVAVDCSPEYGLATGGSVRGRRRCCRSRGGKQKVWSDAGDHGEVACVKEKVWGGLILPEELDGVEAEDGGAQSLALPTFWVTRGRACGTGRCARSNGVCSCEPGAEGWSDLAGIVAAARRR